MAARKAAQVRKAQAAVGKTGCGNMRGAFRTLTGDEVAEGSEQKARELRKHVMEDPAPSDTKFSEETTMAKAAHKNSSPLRITVRTVRRRFRGTEGTESSFEPFWANSECCHVRRSERRSLSDCARSCETR